MEASNNIYFAPSMSHVWMLNHGHTHIKNCTEMYSIVVVEYLPHFGDCEAKQSESTGKVQNT
jgi:hypothetical protein